MTDPQPRPSVSVVVPFLGDAAALTALVDRLQVIALAAGDEVIIADNRPGVLSGGGPEAADGRREGGGPSGSLRIYPAGALTSPGFARNRGAAAATGEWVVFVDADTEPTANLIDAYFDPLPAQTTAILGGAIDDVPAAGARTLVGAHAVARAHMDDAVTLDRAHLPYAQTANCAIRRAPLLAAGGFAEDVRAAEDADLCFRLVAAGWGLERRPRAVVRHRARPGFVASMRQIAGHGAGAAWCERRHPGSFPPPSATALARRIARSGLDAAIAAARGHSEDAAFALLDAAGACAFAAGRLQSNRVRRRRPLR